MISALEGWSFTGPKGQTDDPRLRPRDAAADVPGQAEPRTAASTRQPRRSASAREVHCAAGEEANAGQPHRTEQADRWRNDTPILATHDLGLDIGGAQIVADVSLAVREGELIGIIGPNGAGKTTLFNLLSGVVRPTAGRSRSTAGTSRRAAVRRTPRRARTHVPDLEHLPAAAGRRERPSRRRGAARRHVRPLRRAARFTPALERARLGDLRASAWPTGRLARRSCSPTATSGSSSWRWCWRATPA